MYNNLLQYVSDLHIEKGFSRFIHARNPILVLAGDIGYPSQENYKDFLLHMSNIFDRVYVLPGNHEYDNIRPNDFHHVDLQIENICNMRNNLYQIQKKGYFIENNTLLIGCTLWSSLPASRYQYHLDHVKWLTETLKGNPLTNFIVVTHHCPLYENLYIKKYNKLSGYFATDQTELVKLSNVSAWIHGHSHINKNIHVYGEKVYVWGINEKFKNMWNGMEIGALCIFGNTKSGFTKASYVKSKIDLKGIENWPFRTTAPWRWGFTLTNPFDIKLSADIITTPHTKVTKHSWQKQLLVKDIKDAEYIRKLAVNKEIKKIEKKVEKVIVKEEYVLMEGKKRLRIPKARAEKVEVEEEIVLVEEVPKVVEEVVNVEPIVFTKWSTKGDEEGINDYIKRTIGVSAYSGQGINVRHEQNAVLLRSQKPTFYYDDNLDKKYPIYTCEGQSGDQDRNSKGNKHLLGGKMRIFLYEVYGEGKNKRWAWYGEFTLKRSFEQKHIGLDGEMRTIIQVVLKPKA